LIFSSPIFLFGFLPVALLIYHVSPKAWRNAVLLILSLLFYAWGEVFFIGVLAASIVSNHAIGGLICRTREAGVDPGRARALLTLGVAVNLALLISFKYAGFIADNINALLAMAGTPPVALEPVHLPLGISYFTFQAITYIVDIYRREAVPQDSIYNTALYLSLFPKLIAGPIVRYRDVAPQVLQRSHTMELFSSGVQRFIVGLAKKVLIANPLGEVADHVFSLSGSELTMPLAWIGILSYTLQIYCDFSGYSDMAIGLGRMFGFRFMENFNFPYMSSPARVLEALAHLPVHLFRDYVYIPLGGGRVSPCVYIEPPVVFLLTGIWHGAQELRGVGMCHASSWREHMGFSRLLKRHGGLSTPVRTTGVTTAWVFFRPTPLPMPWNTCAPWQIPATGTRRAPVRPGGSGEAVCVFVLGSVLLAAGL
jgi:alginate O-acetyltransferase complex protein AlgI